LHDYDGSSDRDRNRRANAIIAMTREKRGRRKIDAAPRARLGDRMSKQRNERQYHAHVDDWMRDKHAAVLKVLEPQQPPLHHEPTDAEAARCDRQITKALKLLPPERRELCRGDVGWSIYFMLSVTRADEHGIKHGRPTRKTTKDYVAALRRLQTASRAYASAGGRLLIAQDIVDLMAVIGKRALAHGVATPARQEQLAIQLAHSLLEYWGIEPTISRVSKWHKLAAILVAP